MNWHWDEKVYCDLPFHIWYWDLPNRYHRLSCPMSARIQNILNSFFTFGLQPLAPLLKLELELFHSTSCVLLTLESDFPAVLCEEAQLVSVGIARWSSSDSAAVSFTRMLNLSANPDFYVRKPYKRLEQSLHWLNFLDIVFLPPITFIHQATQTPLLNYFAILWRGCVVSALKTFLLSFYLRLAWRLSSFSSSSSHPSAMPSSRGARLQSTLDTRYYGNENWIISE